MGHPDYRRCAGCGKSTDEPGGLSWTRLCASCAAERLEENVVQMHTRRGPNFDKWRRSMAACVGGVLLDDVAGSSHTHT